MCTAGSSSGSCGEANVSCPIPQNRLPIWKRHIFPNSPAVNVDPFELPSNLTPALRRVKSRSKLPAKGSLSTQSLSKLPKTSKSISSTFSPIPPLRTSPRKKAPSFSLVEGCSDIFLEKRIVKGVNGVVDQMESSAAVAKTATQTPTRARNCLYAVSLPPKKPRLSAALMSCSDLRSARKPVMVEPDYELPPSCTTPSRLSRALRHSSVNLSATFGRDVDAEVCAGSGPTKNIVLPDKPLQMFHSRSTMCLRLTPDRDMRERRRSGAESSAHPTPLDNSKKKLQHSRTVSDLQQMSAVPVRRRRRISLSDTNSKAIPHKPLRTRSSSLDLEGSRTDATVLNLEKEESKLRQLKQGTWLTQDVAKHVDDEPSVIDPEKSESSDARPAVTTEIEGSPILFGEVAASNSEMVADNADQNIIVNVTTVAAPSSEHASRPTVDTCSSVEAVVEKETSESFSDSEEQEEEMPLTALLPSEVEEDEEVQQNSKEAEIFSEKGDYGESVESSDLHIQSKDSRGGEFLPEQDNCGQEVSAACLCATEASSSMSTCLSGSASNAAQSIDVVKDLSTSIETSTSFASQTVKTKLSPNRRVNFRSVTVYYFARTQGMSTVPKSGEVSLGMVDKHFTKRHFPLYHGRRPELRLPEHEEEHLSDGEDLGDVYDPEGLERCTAHQLRLFEGKARIKLLKKSGVQVQKDAVESLESIRQSRILCGCQCEEMCNAETCQCALDGIGCQVDGPDEFGRSHPCSCITEKCLNPFGRVEFDPEHVKNHYRITMMRLHHAEQKGIYDSPQRIRFNSDGEPQSVSHLTPPSFRGPNANTLLPCSYESPSIGDSDELPTRKFPVTPVYKKSKQKRSLKVQLAEYSENTTLLEMRAKITWQEQSLEHVKDQEMVSSRVDPS